MLGLSPSGAVSLDREGAGHVRAALYLKRSVESPLSHPSELIFQK